MELAFKEIPAPIRDVKPRKRGITSMIDWNMPLAIQDAYLDAAAHLIDMAKIGGCVTRFMARDVLQAKLSSYNRHGISVSPGGVFFELAFKQGDYEYFLAECRELGFTSFEVSDTLLDMTPNEKVVAIKAASAAGFKTISEVGKKSDEMDDDSILSDIEPSLEHADYVILEANEFFEDGDIREALIDVISQKYDQSRLLWELPVAVLPGSTRAKKEKVSHWLVSRFGTHVNLANVEAEEIYFSEGVRSGMGGDTSYTEGAYRLAGFP